MEQEKPSTVPKLSTWKLAEIKARTLAFGAACTFVNVYVVWQVWNWHAPTLLRAQQVSFSAIFLIICLLKTALLGRVGEQINQTKRMVYAHSGVWWDTSTRENIDFLIKNMMILGSAYILKQYGYLVWY
jgi:hypothetical protein